MTTASNNAGNAARRAARDLVSRTGMKYTAALATITRTVPPRAPRARWQLMDEVRDYFHGRGWHGVWYVGLYDWLDRLATRFDCRACGEPVNAEVEDASVELVVAAYDPDLSPRTTQVTTRTYHAACRASGVNWLTPPVPRGPYRFLLPANNRPTVEGEFETTLWPLVRTGAKEPAAVLVVIANVTDDHGEGPGSWLEELASWLRDEGLDEPFLVEKEEEFGPQDWALRITPEDPGARTPGWLALRTSPPTTGQRPTYFALTTRALAPEWIAAARARGRVLLYTGPLPQSGKAPILPETITSEDLDELVEDALLLAGWVPLVDPPVQPRARSTPRSAREDAKNND